MSRVLHRVMPRLLAAGVALAAAPASASAAVMSPAAARQQAATQPPPAVADSALEATTTRLASELRCPVCQGNSIQDSPSELAQEMRSVIRDQLRAGKTPDDVRAYFVAKYGEWILLSPRAEGFNLIVYLVPLIAVLAGGAVVWRQVRRWTTAASSGSDTGG
ncbi:MAG: cytochrome c-type biogenesis protein CcmH [Gemmatimonadaceae bacterium]|nr:cytochrome c-type biogenesis protein CcmH [Gemmatimonadaceae bacterium]